MADLVDALVSGASVERRAGSSPVLGTICLIKEQVILEIHNRKIVNLIKTKSKVTFDLRGGIVVVPIRIANSVRQRIPTSAGGEIGIHATLRG